MNHDCINHSEGTSGGYGFFKILGKRVSAHRVAFCIQHHLQLQEIDGLFVMHKCGNPLCVNPAHLKLGTYADCCAARGANGWQAKGENAGNSKLKNAQVVEIKKRLLQGDSATRLAETFGVSPGTIRVIRRGKTWRSV